MKTIRAGVVGPGSIGINHARIYSELEGCELTAIYDANRASAEKAAAKYGGKVCATLEEFASLVDVASVATNTESHHEIGTHLLGQGKHLLIEKPIAVNVEEAKCMLQAARTAARVLYVGMTHRFYPELREAKRLIDDGAIGTPVAGSAFFGCPGHERWHPAPGFYYLRGGGPMLRVHTGSGDIHID
mgnify:CR=1 FL=1